jgi:hypothetical protein
MDDGMKENDDMNTAPITQTCEEPGRLRRGVAAAGALTGLLLVVSGCAAGPTRSNAENPSSTGVRASSHGDQDTVSTGVSAPPSSAEGRSAGGFTVDFAKCMRAHGVPNFPDPDGQAGQLGPNSGIDPESRQFQAALNGPCKALAPPQWLDSGSGSGPDSAVGGK